METAQAVDPGFAFEQFMASMQELRKSQEETAQQLKETDRIVKETAQQMKETDKRLKETDRIVKETAQQMKETGKQMKETDKRVGAITNRFGEMVEYMIIPNLVAKFDDLGFTFTKANRTEIADREHSVFTEVDAFLENGDTVMIVEIKTKPSVEDINDHIRRMEKLRYFADLHGDKRKYLGAMAGAVFSESEKIYALKKGFYVIEPSGDTFNIIEPGGEYYPREW